MNDSIVQILYIPKATLQWFCVCNGLDMLKKVAKSVAKKKSGSSESECIQATAAMHLITESETSLMFGVFQNFI